LVGSWWHETLILAFLIILRTVLMADSSGSLQEIIQQRQQAAFVGREAELALFRDNLALPSDDGRRRILFAVHGDGGVGKTLLVKRMSKSAGESGWLTAVANEKAYDVPEVMAAVEGARSAQCAAETV